MGGGKFMNFLCTAWVSPEGWVLVKGDRYTDDVEEEDKEPKDIAVTLRFEVPDEWFNGGDRVVEARVGGRK
jgi:hypothetical protein